MAGRFALPTPSAYDSSGNPLAEGKLEFYESGTSTPLNTYSDDALTMANANPVVADSAGRWGDIFLKDQDYKVILKSSADVTIDTWDPVRAAEPRSSAVISKTTTYTVMVSDAGKLITADATAGAFTITLPPAATAGDGFEVSVIKVDSSSNAVTVDGDGSETINGNTSLDLAVQFDATLLRSDGTSWHAIVEPVSTTTPVPRGYYSGLELSIDAIDTDHDIEIAAGVARDDGNDANMDVSAAFTKRIDAAWAVGDTNGGMDTGAVAADSLYYVWLIRRSDTGVVDALFSLSASAPTMPSNYDQKRRIGFVRTDGSSNLIPFTFSKDGVYVWEHAPPTTSGSSITVFDNIPSGVRRIQITGSVVSLSGTDQLLLQIGDSGGTETSGYSGGVGAGSSVEDNSSGWKLTLGAGSATDVITFVAQLTLINATTNNWDISCLTFIGSAQHAYLATGLKALSAELDRVVLDTTGSDTFDAGELRYQFDGYPDPRELP